MIKIRLCIPHHIVQSDTFNKIESIKALRKVVELDLRTAKDNVESMMEGVGFTYTISNPEVTFKSILDTLTNASFLVDMNGNRYQHVSNYRGDLSQVELVQVVEITRENQIRQMIADAIVDREFEVAKSLIDILRDHY